MEDNIKISQDSVVVNINPKLYSLDAVYSAAYVFLDRAYVILDGDPKSEILVRLKPKKEEDLETLGLEFSNELINYCDYQKRSAETKKIREMLLERALITNDPSVIPDNEFNDIMNDLEEDGDFLDDPEGIAVPWEEKYGNDADKEDIQKKDENKTE